MRNLTNSKQALSALILTSRPKFTTISVMTPDPRMFGQLL